MKPNPRSRFRSRFANRFLHKFVWSLEQWGRIGCVGCGRCTHACTAKIANPVEVYNALAEGK
jgi:formate hydrogenlyase subunit 6/NADH:ubiquinone oxidoreductase subunit I